MSVESYDGIILGTGHNALVLQAYLARCGMRVLSLDRAETPGGGLSTIENPRFPGFLHNTHSFYHRALNRIRIRGIQIRRTLNRRTQARQIRVAAEKTGAECLASRSTRPKGVIRAAHPRPKPPAFSPLWFLFVFLCCSRYRFESL